MSVNFDNLSLVNDCSNGISSDGTISSAIVNWANLVIRRILWLVTLSLVVSSSAVTASEDEAVVAACEVFPSS